MVSNSGSTYDVVVVGGGIAGLTVAYRLGDRNVLLLEREDISGGRTLSMEMGPYVFNQGAQMIPGSNTNVARLADELGVRKTLIDKTKTATFMNGKLVAASSDFKYLLGLPIPLVEKLKMGLKIRRVRSRYSGIVDKAPDASDPLFRELSEKSLAEILNIKSPGVKTLWDSISMSASTVAVDEVAAFQPVNTFLHHAADEFFVEGGTHQLTLALAKKLAGKIETGACVKEVTPTGDGVTVRYERNGETQTINARKCVMAVPAPVASGVLRQIPETKRTALDECQYGAMSSAAFLVDRPSESFFGKGVWRVPVVGMATIGISDPTYTLPEQMKREDGRGLTRLYSGDTASRMLQQMPDDDALDVFERELCEIFPDARGRVLERAIKSWPYAICPWRVGRLDMIETIRAPHDNIHYCGDYTENSGLESAVLSALRVVSELSKA